MSAVNHPEHYRATTGHEAIDVIEAWRLNFNLGNVVKYISRAGHKVDRLEDLQKALWYLSREVERQEAHANQELACKRCHLPWVEDRICSASGFTTICHAEKTPC